MRIATILGTRPEIIKLGPVLRAVAQHDSASSLLIHTNQHYDRELDAIFFEELALPAPDVNLNVGTHPHGRQVALMLAGIEDVLVQHRPDVVVVQGDTNSTLAGALAAVKLRIPVAHVEAGLRSFDRSMPEEVNRLITDHIATYRLAPTERDARQLAAEGIHHEVHVVGNTVVDALHHRLAVAGEGERPGAVAAYVLVTLHRDSNTDSPSRLRELFTALQAVHDDSGLEVHFPAHPRVIHRLAAAGLLTWARGLPGVAIVEPMGHLDFLTRLKGAAVVLTDSGGVQEEACILGVPAVTLRTTTERQETVEIGANVLAPNGPDVVAAVGRILAGPTPAWQHPFGPGDSGRRIVQLLVERT